MKTYPLAQLSTKTLKDRILDLGKKVPRGHALFQTDIASELGVSRDVVSQCMGTHNIGQNLIHPVSGKFTRALVGR